MTYLVIAAILKNLYKVLKAIQNNNLFIVENVCDESIKFYTGLIEVMHGWLDKDDDSTPGHLLRLMAHIILFLRTIGRACKV